MTEVYEIGYSVQFHETHILYSRKSYGIGQNISALQRSPKPPGGLVKRQITVPIPIASDSGGT
jgi:hypothetical protein